MTQAPFSSADPRKQIPFRHDEALAHLATVADSDARKALNALEIGILTTAPDAEGVVQFTCTAAEESIQKKAVPESKFLLSEKCLRPDGVSW
ncbi:MAG: hypothetical protein ACKV19_09685 [Verrucomicrobiales bacterium]